MSKKGKGNPNFTLDDWNKIPEELIRETVIKEGKPIIAKRLGINYYYFADWFKYRKIDIPLVRNFNYYNSRKPENERLPYEDTLTLQIVKLMEIARSERLKEYEDQFITVICPTCGKEFVTKKDNPQKYCSSWCVSNRVRSEEEKALISKSRIGKEAWNKGKKCSPEQLKHMSEASKKFWARPGFKEEMAKIQKKAWADEDLRKKHSEILTNVYSDPENRKHISEGTKLAMQRPEVKANVLRAAKDPEIMKRRIVTNLKKHGVPFPFMINLSSNGVISQYNLEWAKELKIPTKDMEYKIDNLDQKYGKCLYYSYDLKKGNLLIELDPAITHNCTRNFYNNKDPLQGIHTREDHYIKTMLAINNNFDCIHVWDWDNKYNIQKLIYGNKEEIKDVSSLRIKKLNANEIEKFVYDWSLKDYVNDAYYGYGLFLNDKCIRILVFSLDCNNDYFIKYDCFDSNYNSLSYKKDLLQYFIKDFNPDKITYAFDLSKYIDDNYTNMGFSVQSTILPQLTIIDIRTGHIFNNREETSKVKYTKKRIVDMYDCGYIIYELKKCHHK